MWAVVQLREQSDPIAVEVLNRDLTMRWPEATFRYPAVKHGILDRGNPLSAYVFAHLSGKKATPLQIETSPYVQRVLRDPARRVQYVSDAELQLMVEPTLLPPAGSLVRVTSGDWSGMEGTVVEKNCATVAVLIELWSRKSVVTLAPNEFVEV